MEPSSRKHEPPSTCRFLQLPYPIILDILSRLLINDLLHCRCVCKRFLCFISDPEFASLHLSRSPLCMLVATEGPLFSKTLQLGHIDAKSAIFQVSKLNFTTESNVPTFDCSYMSACNGLICLAGSHKENFRFYVCNPILGEFITIQPPYKDRDRGCLWGFGYSNVTNQYKLLQSYYVTKQFKVLKGGVYQKIKPANYSEMAEIYTIGTGKWRSIGSPPPDYVALPFNAFLNGALHWTRMDRDATGFIHSFDFDTEQFGTVPPSDRFLEDDMRFENFTTFGVLGDCLCANYLPNPMKFDIWAMKEYGVKESWTKQFVIENLYPMYFVRDKYQPMVVLSNGEILMWKDRERIVCYNQKRKRFRRTNFFRSLVYDAIAYTPCFVSLYNVAKREQIYRLQSTRVYEKICTQEFQDCSGCGSRPVNSV